jgi:hypothetical protein
MAHPGHPFPAYYGTPRSEENFDDDNDDMRYQFGRGVATSTVMKNSGNIGSAAVQDRPLQAPAVKTNSNTNTSKRIPESNNFYEEYLRERQRRQIPLGVGASSNAGSNGSNSSGSSGSSSFSGGGMYSSSGMPVAPAPSQIQPLSKTPSPDYSSGPNGGNTGIFTPSAPHLPVTTATSSAPPTPSQQDIGRRPDFSPYHSNIQRPSLSQPISSTQLSSPSSSIDTITATTDASAVANNRELIMSKLDTLAKQQHDWYDRLTKVEVKVDRQAQDHEDRTRRLLEEFRMKNEQTTQSFLKTVTKDIQGMQTTLSSVVNDQKQLQQQQATTSKRMTELETSQDTKLTELESKLEAKLSKLQEEQSVKLQGVKDDMAKKHQQEIDAVKLAVHDDQKAQADRLVAFEKAQVERLTAFEEIQQERTQDQLERTVVGMMQQQEHEHHQMMIDMEMGMDTGMGMEREQQDRRRMQGPPPPRREQDHRRGPPPPSSSIMDQREADGPPPKKGGMLRDRLMQKGDKEQLYQSQNKKKGSGTDDDGALMATDDRNDAMDYRLRMEEEEQMMMMMEDEKRRQEEQAWRNDPLIPPPQKGPRPNKKGVGRPGRYDDDDDEQALLMRNQRMSMIDGQEDAMDFGPPLPPRGGPAARENLLIVDDDVVDNMIGQALNNYRPFQGDDLLAKNPFGNDGPMPMAGKGATGGGIPPPSARNGLSGIADARRNGELASGIKGAASSSSGGGGFHGRGAADTLGGPSSKGGVLRDPVSSERSTADNKKERDGIVGRNQRGSRNDFAPVPPPSASTAANKNRIGGPSIDDRLEHFLRETTKSGPQDHFNKEMESLLMEKYRPMYDWLTPNNALFLRNVLVTFMEHKGCQVEMDLKNATEQAAYEWEELLNILAFELYRLTGEEPKIVSEGSNKWGIYDESGKSAPIGRRREKNNFAVSRQP